MIVETLLLLSLQVAPSDKEVDGAFTEPARALEQGKSFLGAGRIEDAIEAFRAADVDDDKRRAAIEYNVGRALALDAARMKKEADAKEDKNDEVDPELIERLQQAAKAFKRAYETTDDARIKTESAQAAGNALVRAEALGEAIEQYRRSLVADPQNEGARRNLSRALRMMRAQPPSPPEKSDKEKDDKDEDKDQDKDQERQQQQKEDDKKKSGEKKEEQGKKDQQKQDDKEKGDKEKKENDDENKPEPKKGDDDKNEQQKKKDDEKKDGEQPQPHKTKKERERERARQLLDAMRSRERPLDPQIMREHTEPPPRSGREW